MKMYQRANVFRSDTKATRPLIRSREFFWIETHNAFATKKEAEAQVQEDVVMSEEVMHKIFGVPFLPMKRPEWDKFPGAAYTVAADTIMPDGKVLQLPSTHLIDQHFVKAFGVKFVDKKEKEKFPWTTCYGPCMSRIMASILAMHGDDNGLILPYTLAPVQVVIVPFDGKGVKSAVDDVRAQLLGEYIDVKVDDSDKRPGEKFFFWEMKGVPFRMEIGEKELAKDEVSLFIRDTKEKISVSIRDLPETIKNLGAEYDERLIAKADEFFEGKVVDCKDKAGIKDVLNSGKIARFSFCSADKEGEACAEYVEKELQGSIMGTRGDLNEKASGKCPICGKKNSVVVYVGKSY
jgi:prolyl-tRNA synthetase